MTSDSVITCGDVNSTRCHIHDRPCSIAVHYPIGDSRQVAIEAAKSAGAPTHEANSLHYCDLCTIEREEGRQGGFYQQDEYDGRVKPVTVIQRQQRERDELQGVVDAEFTVSDEEE